VSAIAETAVAVEVQIVNKVWYKGEWYWAYAVYDPCTLVLQGWQIIPPGPHVMIPAVGFTPGGINV
jgi:hypothetical protein